MNAYPETIVMSTLAYRAATAVAALAGVFYTATGLALLLAPVWFFQHIGGYPPYNRHYEGDLGAFLLPLGLALLFAARSPQRHATVVRIAALGSALHAVNHVYDAIQRGTAAEWFGTVAPLALFALALGWVALRSPVANTQPTT
jgi:hypothetical protein